MSTPLTSTVGEPRKRSCCASSGLVTLMSSMPPWSPKSALTCLIRATVGTWSGHPSTYSTAIRIDSLSFVRTLRGALTHVLQPHKPTDTLTNVHSLNPAPTCKVKGVFLGGHPKGNAHVRARLP